MMKNDSKPLKHEEFFFHIAPTNIERMPDLEIQDHTK